MYSFFTLPGCIPVTLKKIKNLLPIILLASAIAVQAKSSAKSTRQILPSVINEGKPVAGFIPSGVHNFYFDALLSKDHAVLKWQTSDEQNSQDFLVQHSTDGINWVNIDSVKAAENSISIKNYCYTHNSPLESMNYYRLEQRDIDGEHAFSRIVSLLYKSSIKELTVFPNPVVNNTLNVYLPDAAVLVLYNNWGTPVLQQQFCSGTQQINVSHMPKGVYSITAGKETRKIIIK